MYSFGIVLLEVVCAKEQLLWLLVSRFRSNIQRRTIGQVIDPYLIGQTAPKCLRELLKIAFRCVLNEEAQRPSMDNVLKSLLSALQLQKAWENQVEICADELRGMDQSLQLFHDGEFTIGVSELS